MKFKLRMTTDSFGKYSEGYNQALELGFTFERKEHMLPSQRNTYYLELQGEPTVEINTIEELVDFTEKYGEIIVYKDTIEIYNDYRE